MSPDSSNTHATNNNNNNNNNNENMNGVDQQQQQQQQQAEQKFVREGKAEIIVPEDCEADVFYNPVQEFNRDMSIAAINTWCENFLVEQKEQKAAKHQRKKTRSEKDVASTTEETTTESTEHQEIRLLEALSATGLRSVRYAKECPKVSHIIANDMDALAVEAIKRNIAHNKVEDKVTANQGDANLFMYQSLLQNTMGKSQKFHIVDLDPYGTASPFIDAAVRSVEDGGLLLITCTDMATLAGGQLEPCWVKYGSMPIPNSAYCHEMGLRMLLHSVQTSASRYKRVITPLMSCSIDFYVRIFVRVTTSAVETKKAASKSSMVYGCVGCKSYAVTPIGTYVVNGASVKFKCGMGPPVDSHCKFCGQRYHIGGPIYGGRLHDEEFLQKMIQHVSSTADEGEEKKYGTKQRMLGMLTLISEELHDIPLYYSLPLLCGTLHCQTPRHAVFCSAILHAGYKVSLSHCAESSIKTTAPIEVLWDILRCWVKKNPVSAKNLTDGSVCKKILDVEPSIQANFDLHPEANAPSRKIKLTRYQENPHKNWGPKARAKGAGGKSGNKRGAEEDSS